MKWDPTINLGNIVALILLLAGGAAAVNRLALRLVALQRDLHSVAKEKVSRIACAQTHGKVGEALATINGNLRLIAQHGVPAANPAGPELAEMPEDLAWCDELRTWAYARDTWDNLMFGLRLGQHPRVIITTTPSPIEPVSKR